MLTCCSPGGASVAGPLLAGPAARAPQTPSAAPPSRGTQPARQGELFLQARKDNPSFKACAFMSNLLHINRPCEERQAGKDCFVSH